MLFAHIYTSPNIAIWPVLRRLLENEDCHIWNVSNDETVDFSFKGQNKVNFNFVLSVKFDEKPNAS